MTLREETRLVGLISEIDEAFKQVASLSDLSVRRSRLAKKSCVLCRRITTRGCEAWQQAVKVWCFRSFDQGRKPDLKVSGRTTTQPFVWSSVLLCWRAELLGSPGQDEQGRGVAPLLHGLPQHELHRKVFLAVLGREMPRALHFGSSSESALCKCCRARREPLKAEANARAASACSTPVLLILHLRVLRPF